MTNEDRDKQLEELLDARTAHGVGAERPDVAARGDRDLEVALELADLLSEAAFAPPPLADDPTAVMLGLVPDPLVALDSVALARVRKSKKVAVSELAKKLAARGWDVTTAELFRWETQAAFDLSPALIRAIAEELGASLEQITTRAGTAAKPFWIDQVVTSPTFVQLAQRWAELRSLPEQLARDALEARMLATVHRGGRPQPEQLLQTLDAFVAAMEQGSGSNE